MACKQSFADFTVEELADFLEEKGISIDVVTNILTNRVSGAVFLKLTDGDLRELAPLLGERTSLRDILNKSKQVGCFKKKSNILYI